MRTHGSLEELGVKDVEEASMDIMVLDEVNHPEHGQCVLMHLKEIERLIDDGFTKGMETALDFLRVRVEVRQKAIAMERSNPSKGSH